MSLFELTTPSTLNSSQKALRNFDRRFKGSCICGDWTGTWDTWEFKVSEKGVVIITGLLKIHAQHASFKNKTSVFQVGIRGSKRACTSS